MKTADYVNSRRTPLSGVAEIFIVLQLVGASSRVFLPGSNMCFFLTFYATAVSLGGLQQYVGDEKQAVFLKKTLKLLLRARKIGA